MHTRSVLTAKRLRVALPSFFIEPTGAHSTHFGPRLRVFFEWRHTFGSHRELGIGAEEWEDTKRLALASHEEWVEGERSRVMEEEGTEGPMEEQRAEIYKVR